MAEEKKQKKGHSNAFYIKWFWGVFCAFMLAIIVFFVLLSEGYLGYMPSFAELDNPKSALATEVISADGKVLGRYYVENRSQVDFEGLSKNMINAVVATEDERFWEHSGIDLRSLGRVLFKTVIAGNNKGGGSTITQQLAKLLFHYTDDNGNILTPTKWERVTQKLKEWIISVKLEHQYTKEEILTMYLNRAEYIYDAYGIESASWTFFSKGVSDLKKEEAALLAGMLQNPSLYNPVRRPEKALARRNVALGQMLKNRYISKSEHDSLVALPLGLQFRREDHKTGLAPYFREYIRMMLTAPKPEEKNYPAKWQKQKYIEDCRQWEENPAYGWIAKNPKADGSYYNIYKDGLKIRTTIDSRLQQYAEQAMTEHLGGEIQPLFFAAKKGRTRAPYSSDITKEQYDEMIGMSIRNSDRYRTLKRQGFSEKQINENMRVPVEMKVFSWKGERDTVMTPYDSVVYHKFFLRAGMMSVDPRTGYIKAYVGGPNYKYFQYDMVTMGKRQVGSTIKPFVYCQAMKDGHTPCDLVPNTPQTFVLVDGTTWTPKNAGHDREGEMVSLKWGLANSNNNVTAWVMKQSSPQGIAQLIHDLGVRSHVEPVYSLCLGTSDLCLHELVGAYATFANKGVHIDPLAVTSIEDKYGNTIATFSSTEREAIDEETAYLMINLLEGVINQGTGRRLRGPAYRLTNKMGGKTGTTQSHSDGWFMSVLPHLVSGVWVGGEDRSIHFDDMRIGQASNMAIPIFGRFILKVFADPKITEVQETDEFEKPLRPFSLDCSDQHINADGESGDEVIGDVVPGEPVATEDDPFNF